jgi:hypothetical protein
MEDIDMTNEEAIRQLLALDEEELYVEIGREFSAKQALPLDPRELAERGKRLFSAQVKKLTSSICENSTIRSMAENNSEDAQIVVEIINLISSLILPVSPITLAALLVKRGVKKCCENYWTE